MPDKSLGDLFSNLNPSQNLGSAGAEQGAEHSLLAVSLKTAAGQAGSDTSREVANFLDGRGALLETTRAAVSRGGTASAVKEVAAFLESQLHVSPALAQIIAPLVLRLFPAVGKLSGGAAASKPKPKPHSSKPKPRPSSTTRPKPKKRKTSSSSTPKKPKTSSSTKPKPKPKPRRRLGEID